MKFVYINDELATGDGSNSHAIGMLRGFEQVLGINNVISFPKAENGSEKSADVRGNALKKKLRFVLQIIRVWRKFFLSIKKSNEYIYILEKMQFVPTYIIARSTSFDVTAIYVAKHFNAKLIYEVNTPMFYESIVLHKEPLSKKIEQWERKILQESDYVYCVSNVCRNMLCEHYQLNDDKFVVIPNGYMRKLYFESQEEKDDIRKNIRKKEKLIDQFIVIFVGSLKAWHGIVELCKIAEAIETYKDIAFLVLGDGEMHECVSDYAKTHRNMLFKGKVDLNTMKNYLYASDLGIMPYEKREHFYYSPLKMYDLIGAGLPFIGTSIGQVSEFCSEHLTNDFLLDNPDVTEYVQRILALKLDSNRYTSMKMMIDKLREFETWEERCKQLLTSIE